MAQQGVQLDREQTCCSICLDLLKDPVTVPCGHSYCRRCIEGFWNQDDQRGRFSCPQCSHTFIPRPILKKSTMLAEVVESLKKAGLQDVSETVNEEGTNVSETVNRVDVSPSTPPEPKTRAEFLQYSRPITLDPNTAHQDLSLSKGNRKVSVANKPQSYPDHPERFTGYPQVLSREALTGRCYWEAEWSGDYGRIAVSYKDINRTGTGNECGFGYNDTSWSLQCTKQGYYFTHRGIETPLPGCVSSRVGVYVDHGAGTLSFYSVSDTMTLLHTEHTIFTHNLHAGFWLYLSNGDTAELCDLK